MAANNPQIQLSSPPVVSNGLYIPEFAVRCGAPAHLVPRRAPTNGVGRKKCMPEPYASSDCNGELSREAPSAAAICGQWQWRLEAKRPRGRPTSQTGAHRGPEVSSLPFRPKDMIRAERAGRVAPDVPAGPLRAASRRTRLPGATASRPDTHNYTVRRDVRRGADGQPTAGQDDILRVKGATQPGRSRLVADGAGYQCGGNAWTRGWWHRPTPRQRSTSIWHRPLLGRWKANPPSVGTKKARRRRH